MEEYIKIELGSSFLLNAGICGFLKLLDYSKAQEDRDYRINGQILYVSKEYLLTENLADLYIKSMVNRFKEKTRFNEIMKKRHILEYLYENKKEFNKDETAKINEIYKEFIQMLEKNSFKAGYVILEDIPNIEHISLDMISNFKKEKDILKQKELYFKICDILEEQEVQEILIFKELMYSKINMFYEGTSFFLPSNLKKSIKECYNKDFIQPIIDEFTSTKIKKKRCIECSNLTYNTKSISFMLDTTDDVSRKKSHYWNQKPDAFVCPICAFLYTLVPLGFQFLGRDAIFINNNSSIKSMCRIMDTYESKDNTESNVSSKSKLYRIFTEQKIDMLKNKVSNIQVVVRTKEKDHFEMNVISKDTIKKLVEGKENLVYLERKYIKQGDKFKSVYDEVFDNILYKRSQYQLIHKLFLYELKNNGNVNYIKNILTLEIIFKGGISVDEIKKNVDSAWKSGIAMRNKLTESVQEKDVDNSLRGLVYKLSNSLSIGNCEQFIDTIIRVYSGKGMPIPYIFKECYGSEEMFKAIGQGFILGLKYTKFEKSTEIQKA